MEYQKTYDGEGLKGALWTLAGTSIFNAATKGAGCNGGVLGNLLGGGCGENAALAAQGSMISALQADNARLQSEKYADNKLQEFYNYFVGQNEKLSNELCLNRQRLAVLEYQAAQFAGLTVTRIPNTALCPGVPTVEVVHPTATTAAVAA